MRKLLLAMVVLGACGGNDGGGDDGGGGTCVGQVESIDQQDDSVVVSGEFDEGAPIMVLTAEDDTVTDVDCDLVNANNATCSLAGLASGDYVLSFDIACDDGTKSLAAIGSDVPDTLTVP